MHKSTGFVCRYFFSFTADLTGSSKCRMLFSSLLRETKNEI